MCKLFMKTISTILAVMSVMSASTPAAAQENDNIKIFLNDVITEQDIHMLLNNEIRDLMDTVIKNPNSIDIDEDKLKNSYLGSPFSIINESENGFEKEESIKYIPIIYDEEILSLITILKDNGEFFCSVGKSFAPRLNDYLKTFDGSFALVQTGGGVFVVNEGSSVYTVADCFNECGTVFSLSAEADLYSQISDSDNIVSLDSLCKNKYPFFQMDSENEEIEFLDAYYADNFLKNYPIVKQSVSGLCWACVVASIVMFEKPSVGKLTGEKVSDMVGITYDKGAYYMDIINALEIYLSSPYDPWLDPYAMNLDEIKAIIDNNDPACMLCFSTKKIDGRTQAHTTALYGYHINYNMETSSLSIMEPHNGSKITVARPANSSFKFVVDNVTFEWDQTIKLYK